MERKGIILSLETKITYIPSVASPLWRKAIVAWRHWNVHLELANSNVLLILCKLAARCVDANSFESFIAFRMLFRMLSHYLHKKKRKSKEVILHLNKYSYQTLRLVIRY